MADRDDDSSSNRGFAAMDRETRERIARKGGEESHKNDPGRSPGRGREGSPGRGDEGSSGRGSPGGGRGGVWYDEDAGQCRDESGFFVECPEGMGGKSTREDPNKERVAAKGGHESHKNDPGRSYSRGEGGSSGGGRETAGSRGGGSSGGRSESGREGGSSGRSEGGRGGEGSSTGRRESSRGGHEGGRGEGRGGVWYDEDAGQCRDETGLFVECPQGMGGKGTHEDPNKERVATRGGEHSHGGHGRASGDESSRGRD